MLLRILANGGLRGLGLILVAAAAAVPAFAYWHATRPPYYGVSQQVTLPLPQEQGTSIPAYRHGVLVLCYHDLSNRPHNIYTVAPSAFAAQMAALAASGFHTITGTQFAEFVSGRHVALPSRPLLITFDDGAKGTWIYADPVLRRLGYRASVFLITGDVSRHQPYYLDWPEVEAMARTGRWSFGSHTAYGHGLVRSDNEGDWGPFLTNRMWLAAQDRLETLAEYRTRVARDLDESIADIEEHGLPRPRIFAYPFSASRTPTNDAAVGPMLDQMLKARFWALLDNTTSATLIRRGMQAPLPRVEVFHGINAASLLSRVRSTVLHSLSARAEAGRGAASKT